MGIDFAITPLPFEATSPFSALARARAFGLGSPALKPFTVGALACGAEAATITCAFIETSAMSGFFN